MVLGKLTSQLGFPLMIDKLTDQKDRGQLARFLVNVEIKDKTKRMYAIRMRKAYLLTM